MSPDAWATSLANKCVPGPAPATLGTDRISRNAYDSAGRLTESWDGVGTPLERREAAYTYNANGRKLSLTDARGYKAEMRYDGFGRQQRWIFPSKTTPGVADQSDFEQYLYDSAGNRTKLRKRDGGVLTYTYDALNRVVIKETPGNIANVRYAYDLRGLQTSAWYTGNSWSVFNSYDGFGRLTSTTTSMGGVSRTVSHQYDREGRDSEITFPDGEKFWTARDGLGRATEAYQGPLGSTSTIMVAFAYNPASQLSYFARRFGDATAYGYDFAGRLSAMEDYVGSAAGNSRSDFLYNPAGQLRSETRTNDAYAWTGSVAVSRDYARNGQNQYIGTTSGGSPGASFGYDANGNLTSTTNAPWSTSYVYDSENRLISASGTENATLTYDPFGRLFQISSPATGVTQFLYDGDELVAEYNGSGILLRRYVHGDGDDDPLFWYEGAGFNQPRFPHVNHQGSVTATVGLAGINTYDEYGIPGASNLGRFQYTGQAWIPELGLYYYKARFYSPTLGRFMQTDPIGYEDQINLYAYVGNDPVDGTDPSGLTCTGTHIACEGGIAPGLSGSTTGEFAYYQRGGRTAPPVTRPVGIGRGNNARMAPGGIRGQQAPGGHGATRHVGRTPRQLQERLQRERRLTAASTFRSEAAANRALSGAVRQNQEQINDWVRSGDPFPLEVSFTSRVPLGTVLYRGQSTPHVAHTATFVLRPAPSNAWITYTYDYYVHTGYVH